MIIWTQILVKAMYLLNQQTYGVEIYVELVGGVHKNQNCIQNKLLFSTLKTETTVLKIYTK